MELARIARSSPDRRRMLRAARQLLHERSQPEEGDLLEQIGDYLDELEALRFGGADGRHEDPADDLYSGDLDDDGPAPHPSIEAMFAQYFETFRKIAHDNRASIESLRSLFGGCGTREFCAIELYASEVTVQTTTGQAEVRAAECWRLADVFVAARPQTGGAA